MLFRSQSSSLSAGAHAVSAEYNGDVNFLPSYFTAQHQVIPIVYPTSILLTANPKSVLAGQTISFQAAVTSPGQTPYGTVSFLDGKTPLGAVTLDDNSLAVFDTALLSPGTHSVTAYYLGNANFVSGTSSPVSVVVTSNATTTALTANPSTVAVGATVLLTATVASPAGTPTGSVIFYDGSTLLQNIALDANGVAVYSAAFSTAGAHPISVIYGANASFASSTSPTVNVTVTANPPSNATATSLQGMANSRIERGFIFTAKVSAGTSHPNGDLIFFDGSSRLAAVALDETGSATYQSSSFRGGALYQRALPGEFIAGAECVFGVGREYTHRHTRFFNCVVAHLGCTHGRIGQRSSGCHSDQWIQWRCITLVLDGRPGS